MTRIRPTLAAALTIAAATCGCLQPQARQARTQDRHLPKGTVEFHILTDPSLDPRGCVRAAEVCEEVGPETWSRVFAERGGKPDGLAWFQVDADEGWLFPREQVLARWQDRTYVLAYTDDARSIDQHDKWRITDLRWDQTGDDRGRVLLRLDENGGRLMTDLTRNHMGDLLGIVVKGRLQSAARINSEVNRTAAVTGEAGQMSELHARLESMMTR